MGLRRVVVARLISERIGRDAAVSFRIAPPSRVFACTLLGVDSCWASGGPEWLFASAVVGLWMAAAFGVLSGIAWAHPRVRPKPSRLGRILGVLPGAATSVLGAFGFLMGHPGPLSIAFVGVLVVASAAMVMVVRRAQLAVLDGVPLGGGMAVAFGVVRWSTLMTAVVAGAVGGSSVVAMVTLGHSCSGPFPGQ